MLTFIHLVYCHYNKLSQIVEIIEEKIIYQLFSKKYFLLLDFYK